MEQDEHLIQFDLNMIQINARIQAHLEFSDIHSYILSPANENNFPQYRNQQLIARSFKRKCFCRHTMYSATLIFV